MRRFAVASLVLPLSWLFTAGAAWAQFPFPVETRDPATAVKFNLSTPGARSLAMGGAFLGLADDATAAYTNPAGLTNLTLGGSEVAVEVRQARFTSSFADRGHYNTTAGLPTFPTQIGQDTVDGLQLGEARSETSGLSFLSFGYVLPRGLVLAVYRHELGNFRNAFDSEGPFNDDFCLPFVPSFPGQEPPDTFPGSDCELYRVLPLRSRLDLEIVNYGLSMALAFDFPLGGLESSLSLGLGLSYYEAELSRLSEVFDLCGFDQFDDDEDDMVCTGNPFRRRLPGGFFGPADFSPDNSRSQTTEAGKDEAFGLNLGFLWKLGREQRWSIGGVFRQGPEFDTEVDPGPRLVLNEDGDGLVLIDPGIEPGKLTVPDVIGVGVAYRSAEGKTKITVDANRVRYSQTLVDFTSDSAVFPEDFDLQDVDQFHLGLERTILVVESLFVGSARFGAWYEPFHEPVYVACLGPEGPEGDFCDGDLDAAIRQGRPTDDEIHLSAGLGLVIKEDYQIDMAVDVSDPVTTVSFSLVKFF